MIPVELMPGAGGNPLHHSKKDQLTDPILNAVSCSVKPVVSHLTDKHVAQKVLKSVTPGVSFRVGQYLARTTRGLTRYNLVPELLRVSETLTAKQNWGYYV
jgi:hypothetical protein